MLKYLKNTSNQEQKAAHSDREGVVVLDFCHDESRLDGAYRVDSAEFVEQEIAVLSH